MKALADAGFGTHYQVKDSVVPFMVFRKQGAASRGQDEEENEGGDEGSINKVINMLRKALNKHRPKLEEVSVPTN